MSRLVSTVKNFFNSRVLKSANFIDSRFSRINSLSPNLVEFSILLVPKTTEFIQVVSELYSIDQDSDDFGITATIMLSIKNDLVLNGCKRHCNLMGDMTINIGCFSRESEYLQINRYSYTPFSPLVINGSDGIYQARDHIEGFLNKLECSLVGAYDRLMYAKNLSDNVRHLSKDLDIDVVGGVDRGCCDIRIGGSGVCLKTTKKGMVVIEIPEGGMAEEKVYKILKEAVC